MNVKTEVENQIQLLKTELEVAGKSGEHTSLLHEKLLQALALLAYLDGKL